MLLLVVLPANNPDNDEKDIDDSQYNCFDNEYVARHPSMKYCLRLIPFCCFCPDNCTILVAIAIIIIITFVLFDRMIIHLPNPILEWYRKT